MKLLLVISLSLAALGLPRAALCATPPAPQVSSGRGEWEALQKRFNEPRNYNLLISGTWTLIHVSRADAEVKELLNLVGTLSETFERQTVGGAAGFKEKVASFLKSGDDTVGGFAATLLAATGDVGYAPRIAELLTKKEPPEDDHTHPLTSRGRAAVALGLLGAKEYVAKLVPMLGSTNRYDRAGAASALGMLGARQHAKAVAALLTGERFRFERDASPIHALFDMGVAAEYAGAFASVLSEKLAGPEVVEAAGYALAALKAKRYAGDIARLLNHKYRRRVAAKALAVMGAAEYAPEIARMLREDDDPLHQSAALLALGVLGARKYAPEAARILREKKEDYVSRYAAEALVLMGAEEYAAEVVPVVERAYAEKLYVFAGEFHPLVEGELAGVRRRFEDSFLKMRARLKAGARRAP